MSKIKWSLTYNESKNPSRTFSHTKMQKLIIYTIYIKMHIVTIKCVEISNHQK
jgi:hypothetical protein